MFVCCECCVMSGRGLCDELITRPEESYRLWCVVVCDLETSWMRRPWPTGGCRAKNIINEISDDNEMRLVNFPQYPKIMLSLMSETQTYWHSQLQVVSFWTHDTKYGDDIIIIWRMSYIKTISIVQCVPFTAGKVPQSSETFSLSGKLL